MRLRTMKTKLAAASLCMAAVMAVIVPMEAGAAQNVTSHIHHYKGKVYDYTTQEGSYTHSVVVGVTSDGQPEWGVCTAIEERLYYREYCDFKECNASRPKACYTVIIEHSHCDNERYEY